MKLFTLALLQVLLVAQVLSWHETGHMLVAKVAEMNLIENGHQEVVDKAVTLLELFSKFCGEDKYPFIEAATWPDKVKAGGARQMDDWHWISQLISIDGTQIPVSAQIDNYTPFNVTHQITADIKTLQFNNDSGKDQPRYGHDDRRFQKSIFLRDLIHFVGDVHQPLHAAETVSQEKPQGDMGGNLWKCTMDGFKGSNLHFFWDHIFYHFDPQGDDSGELESPLPEHKAHLPEKYASEITGKYPIDAMEEKWGKIEVNPESWANEQIQIVKDIVHNGIPFDSELTDDYIQKGIAVCEERIALGGYRLAAALVKAFKYDKNGINMEDI